MIDGLLKFFIRIQAVDPDALRYDYDLTKRFLTDWIVPEWLKSMAEVFEMFVHRGTPYFISPHRHQSNKRRMYETSVESNQNLVVELNRSRNSANRHCRTHGAGFPAPHFA